MSSSKNLPKASKDAVNLYGILSQAEFESLNGLTYSKMKATPLYPKVFDLITKLFASNPTPDHIQVAIAVINDDNRPDAIDKPNVLNQVFFGTLPEQESRCRPEHVFAQLVEISRQARGDSSACENCHGPTPHVAADRRAVPMEVDVVVPTKVPFKRNSAKKASAKLADVTRTVDDENLPIPADRKRERDDAQDKLTYPCKKCVFGSAVSTDEKGGRGKKAKQLIGYDWSTQKVLDFFSTNCCDPNMHKDELLELCKTWWQTWIEETKVARTQLKSFAEYAAAHPPPKGPNPLKECVENHFNQTSAGRQHPLPPRGRSNDPYTVNSNFTRANSDASLDRSTTSVGNDKKAFFGVRTRYNLFS